MSHRKKAAILVLGVILLGIPAWWVYLHRGVKVRVRNVGSKTLHSMVVHVTGHSYSLGDLNAGASESVRVHATGESHVEVEFKDEKGIARRLVVGGYFEGGSNRGTITADLNSEKVLKVTYEVTVDW